MALINASRAKGKPRKSRNKKKKDPKNRLITTKTMRGRFFIVLIVLLICLAWLVGNLVYLQVFDQQDQTAAQVDQLVTESEITAQRGNIYDRNMNVLVQDSSAKSVNVIPHDIREGETDKLADTLSTQLGLDLEQVKSKLTKLEDDIVEVQTSVSKDDANTFLAAAGDGFSYDNGSIYVTPAEVKDQDKAVSALMTTFSMTKETAEGYVKSLENSPVQIKSKVDNSLAESIQASQTTYDEEGNVESTNGVELLEDKRRYYTNGNFASYVLGFTGDDHTGLNGVEATFNDLLAGQNGIVLYQKDANGKTIPSQTKIVKEAQKGEDLVLTIDSKIQIAAEKALSSAVTEWKAKSGTCIVMNTKTGEIIAMATKPDYDLNNPYQIDATYASTHTEELAALSSSEQLESMWKNQAVSFVYEPGSTFKPITVAAALEEGTITPDTTVECTGSINVEGTTINCTGIHGTQTISQVLENSCNPGMVQIIQYLNPLLFYRYVYDFGFGTYTGIDLTGEEEGIVNRIFSSDGSDDVNIVDYSTFSFGQGLATTPIQLLCALNCLVNDGNYISPQIQYTGDTVESTRQVISQATSEELRKDLKGVVDENKSLAQLAEGYSIGGKTGTAQKFVDGSYSTTKYVTSFFCFAPVDDPEYSVLVLLDEPDPSAYGGTSAAPVAISILEQTLNYNGGGQQAEDSASESVVIPDVAGQELDSVTSVLEERGITYQIERTNGDEGNTILSQSIAARTTYNTGDILVLQVGTQSGEGDGVLPDFTGMSVQAVNSKIKELGLNLKVEGSGFAVSQSIPAGSKVNSGTEITVTFQ